MATIKTLIGENILAPGVTSRNERKNSPLSGSGLICSNLMLEFDVTHGVNEPANRSLLRPTPTSVEPFPQ